MAALIKVIIADDHRIFVDGLSEIIARISGVDIVATASNGEEVLQKIAKTTCDLAILDIHMPVRDGLETAKTLKKQFPRIKVLILTMNNELSLIKSMLEAGALGYILKTTGKEELERAIRRVAAGLTYFSEAVASELARQYLPKSPELVFDSAATAEPMPLTEREKEIVALVAREYSTPEIANLLFIAPTTVDTHRRNIIQKLGVKSSVGLAKYALKHGLID